MGNGGTVAWVGHLYGFGSTLDKALRERFLAMFEGVDGGRGGKERGRQAGEQVDGPLDHSTLEKGMGSASASS